ncbi:MAG: biotin-dependent carboxyltransferase [Verrucomicrobia bacterium]|nr:biotin-dependent carboxyltransferase [Verrucomicrobiota bacterium]
MDPHAAGWANQLLGNPPDSPVLELLLQGAKIAALRPVWAAVTGARANANVPLWRVVRMDADDMITFGASQSGVWTYIAIEGGFVDEPVLGSVATSPRVRLGRSLRRGAVIRAAADSRFSLPQGVAGRMAPSKEQRDYRNPPPLRVWPGPDWDAFPSTARSAFLHQPWTISSRSDRSGYRLEGKPLPSTPKPGLSEPVLIGTVQVPEDGRPIVTLNDGPTVGGYPRLALVDQADLPWLTQCRSGQTVRFQGTA